jgi:hypothetical protein
MTYRSSAPKNEFQQKFKDVSSQSRNPPDEADRITYGVISEVNFNNGQVKVKKLLADGKIGDEISEGFLPLSTPLSEIHLLWGALREGLVVRVYYKGKLTPRNQIIEVIGDEEHSFLNKEPISNEIEIGPYKIFSGGIGL